MQCVFHFSPHNCWHFLGLFLFFLVCVSWRCIMLPFSASISALRWNNQLSVWQATAAKDCLTEICCHCCCYMRQQNNQLCRDTQISQSVVSLTYCSLVFAQVMKYFTTHTPSNIFLDKSLAYSDRKKVSMIKRVILNGENHMIIRQLIFRDKLFLFSIVRGTWL